MDKLETWLKELNDMLYADAEKYAVDHKIVYGKMLASLADVKYWSEQGDIEQAVLTTFRFAVRAQKAREIIELPNLIDQAYSEKQSNNAKEQHGWTAAQQRSLDNDMVALSVECASPTALYKKCAARINGMDEKQYRKIWHQASLLYPAVKSPY